MRLDTDRHQLDGWATIGYRSGADSSLTSLWLHAYPNAFSGPGTIYAREAERRGEDYEVRFAPARDRGWMTLDSATVEGAPARVTVDETLARIDLPRPLAPGDSTSFRVHFRVGVPRVFDRFGHVGRRYSIAQWYPKMVVYDEGGWARDPYHYFAEFYGEFATFDVAITLPDDEWVGATGVLVGAEAGDNEVPLQDVSRDSVTVRVRAALPDSLALKSPRGVLRLEPIGGAAGSGRTAAADPAPGTISIPRDSAMVWRVPAGAPIHYRYEWAESAGAAPRLELDEAGRPGPIRWFAARRDTAVFDSLRSFAPAARDRDDRGDRHRDGAAPDTTAPSLKTLRFRADRVHDFAFVAAPDYVRADTTWNGIAIRTLVYRSDVPAWRAALTETVEALRHHSDLVGPYIWPQFTTAETFTAGGAMEYPMLIMTDPDITRGPVEALDPTISHEAGHNWFYGMIANDERKNPWLDEGFAQFLQLDDADGRYPRGMLRWRDRFTWIAPAREYLRDEASLIARHDARDEIAPARAANDCLSYPQYGTMAYSRPAMMLRTFEGIEGREGMRAFLGEIYRRRVGRHIRPEDVVEAARAATGRDYAEFFHQWIETTDLPDFALGATRRERTADGWRSTVVVKRKGAFGFPVPVEARYADGTTERKLVPTPAARNEVVFEHRAPLQRALLDPEHEIFDANRLDNQGSLIPPLRVRPLVDITNAEAVSVLYGPTIWHGRAEGMRLGAWVDGRYLPSADFPRGLRSFEGGVNAGTRDGSIAWRVGYARRIGALGARGSVRALASRDAGLLRGEVTLSNWITGSGRLHPWRTWSLRGQYLDRDAAESFDGTDRVDAAHWSAGRTLSAGASLRLDTKGPRRTERVVIEAWHGGDPDRGGAFARPRFDRVSVEVRQSLELGARSRTFVETRLYGGLVTRTAPAERLFDAVEATRLESLDNFYENDRGPLRESGHYWGEGGGGLRGYVGRLLVGPRIASGSIEARVGTWPISLFVDAARLETSAPPGTSTDRSLADAGLGFRAGRFRIHAPVWISDPEPGEKPFDARWVVSFALPDPRFH